MDITIGVTIPNDLKSTAATKCEELLISHVLAANPFVMSAVILRPDQVAQPHLNPDEHTRESR